MDSISSCKVELGTEHLVINGYILTKVSFQEDFKDTMAVEHWYNQEKESRPDLPKWPVVVFGPVGKVGKIMKAMSVVTNQKSTSCFAFYMPILLAEGRLTCTYPDSRREQKVAAIFCFKDLIRTLYVPPLPGTDGWVGALHVQVLEEHKQGNGDLFVVNASHPSLSVRDTLYALNLPGQPSRSPHHWHRMVPQEVNYTCERILSGIFIAITAEVTRDLADKKSNDSSGMWQKVVHRAFMLPPAVDELFADIRETGGRLTIPGQNALGALEKSDRSNLPPREPEVNRERCLSPAHTAEDGTSGPPLDTTTTPGVHASSSAQAFYIVHESGSIHEPLNVSQATVERTEGSDEMAREEDDSATSRTQDPVLDFITTDLDNISSDFRPVIYAVYKPPSAEEPPEVLQEENDRIYGIEEVAKKEEENHEADQAKKAKQKKKKNRDRERLKRQKIAQREAMEAASAEQQETTLALQELLAQGMASSYVDETADVVNVRPKGQGVPFKLPSVVPALPDMQLLQVHNRRPKCLLPLEQVNRVAEVKIEQSVKEAVATPASKQITKPRNSESRIEPEEWLPAQLEIETKSRLGTRTQSMNIIRERPGSEQEQSPDEEFEPGLDPEPEPELHLVPKQGSGSDSGTRGRQRSRSLARDHHFRVWNGPAPCYWYLAEPLRSLMNLKHAPHAHLPSTANFSGAAPDSANPIVQKSPPRYRDSMPGYQPRLHTQASQYDKVGLHAEAYSAQQQHILVGMVSTDTQQSTVTNLANRFPRLGQSRFTCRQPLSDGGSVKSIASDDVPAKYAVTGHEGNELVSRI